jgi:tetratricopeptide (TPR) repeat protein
VTSSIEQHQVDDLLRTADLPKGAIDWCRRSLKASRSYTDITNTIGDLYLRSGKLHEAIRCFSEVANHYSSNGHVSKSIAVLKKISRLVPTDPDVLMRIGDLLTSQGLPAEARMSYVCAGDSQYAGGRPEAAIVAYEKAIAVGESNVQLHMTLGGLYLERGILRKAHQSFISARREYLKKGQISSARRAAASAHSIEGMAEFQSDRDFCRRKEERYVLRLPTTVVAENRQWRESTESLNISKSGIRFGLVRPLELDWVVGLLMQVPAQLGLGTIDETTYAVDAIVCHSERTDNGRYIIGAEFGMISKLTEESFL